MTDQERAEYVLGLSTALRDGMRASISMLTPDADEQEQIAGAVLAVLVRDMRRARGTLWLERLIAMSLKD